MANSNHVFTKLPADIRDQLERRLIETDFADFDGHAEWLRGLGYNISRSSLHRYASGQKADVIRRAGDDSLFLAELRLRCFELAMQINHKDDGEEEIKRTAESIFKWIFQS